MNASGQCSYVYWLVNDFIRGFVFMTNPMIDNNMKVILVQRFMKDRAHLRESDALVFAEDAMQAFRAADPLRAKLPPAAQQAIIEGRAAVVDREVLEAFRDSAARQGVTVCSDRLMLDRPKGDDQ